MGTIERDIVGNPIISFLEPPKNSPGPEMDFNSVIYFKQTNLKTEKITREELWHLILHPKTMFESGVSLKMRAIYGGQLLPAHIPSISDSLTVHPNLHELFRWHVANDLPVTQHTLIPPYLMPLLDPEPNIDLDHLPYSITTETETLKLSMASYSDGFQVVKLPTFQHVLHLQIFRQLTGVTPEHLTVVIDPFSKNYMQQVAHISPVPPGTTLICWNVRGVARQSFAKHFRAVNELHRPAIFILLETRNTVANIIETVNKLPGKFSFTHSAMLCHSGGAVLLWRSDRVHCCDRFVAPDEDRVMDVMIQGFPDGRRKRTQRRA